MRIAVPILLFAACAAAADLEKARDAQDRGTLEKLAAQSAAEAQQKPKDAEAQYKLALAHSYIAEVAIEQRDKNTAHNAAEAGIKAAERAVRVSSALRNAVRTSRVSKRAARLEIRPLRPGRSE